MTVWFQAAAVFIGIVGAVVGINYVAIGVISDQCRSSWAAQGYEGLFFIGQGCKVKLGGKWLP